MKSRFVIEIETPDFKKGWKVTDEIDGDDGKKFGDECTEEVKDEVHYSIVRTALDRFVDDINDEKEKKDDVWAEGLIETFWDRVGIDWDSMPDNPTIKGITGEVVFKISRQEAVKA